MTSSRYTRLLAVVLPLLVAACEMHESPTAIEAGFGPAMTAVPASPTAEYVVVCKVGPAGVYEFTASGEGRTGDAASGSFDLNAGECEVVALIGGAHRDVTVSELGPPAGTKLDSIKVEQLVHPSLTTTIRTGTNTATARVGGFDGGAGAHITFYNSVVPPPTPCGECDGKVTTLTLRNNGPAANVSVQQKKDDIVLFSGPVAAGATFTFNGSDKNGTMGTEIRVFVNGSLHVKIHTSCSQPIGPGQIHGDFEITAGESLKGGPLCALTADCDFCKDGAKPMILTMDYTGDACAASKHSQDSGKVSCSGNPAFASPVRIIATDKDDPADSKAKIFFDGMVALGGTFDIDATRAGEDKLKSNTWVHILDGSGNILQSIKFHTSCSQPLNPGDQYGSLTLTGFTAKP